MTTHQHPLIPPIIPTRELKMNDVPLPNAKWTEIARFALTFDPRKEEAPYVDISDLDKAVAQSTLVELRTHLYVHQRWWGHSVYNMDNKTETKLREIVGLIRQKLAAGE